MKTHLVKLFLSMALSSLVLADAPLGSPQKHSVLSANGKYEATSIPLDGTKCVDKSTQEVLWRIPKWFRHLLINNDGRCAVVVYDGYLLPLNYDKKMTLLTFIKDGKVIREVPVEEVISDPGTLIRTVSSYEWGEIEGFDGKGFLRVRLADQKILLYDPETGTKHEAK